ncbi:MAG: BlaI/MecI/CopY family transcriptional regulator [Erythrobacter sp.]|jgi:predicted transcriptional regulator|uniref:BlaI/MecI/CopY family transcriptional regulator n=1 Tax=Qipengyuania TaxID=1855416 RepID=UPI000BC608A4|nr:MULTISPECIES: BlaI/MecI/CopY family transcriptional regulator [Qipengyuania]MBL4718421.1 BlaI/MecI/CopY family transcriptional regulator [Erythrobacter sp.]PCH77126.1 MAG: CopY family transcriptional repressor [Erythrobacteraceae bacterium]WPL55791.1 BlaI/MecI/CopY family transcriptional regulator [Qipengyuania sp. HL-TH5]MCP2016320.1 putative transcriptional regulator [Qipengyuania citrea]MDE0900388.1 BlaI/MecI/CopY family transcriptional regulator [Erythrobacter sp.]|tara:strand:+ start:251 stop:640 length:390 start_codon:yes stop_codon:yes gene_type:complete
MSKRKDAPGERISEAEHAVMEVLWDRNPISAAEVCEAICARRDWSIPTVKTLLSRLVQKQVVSTEPQGRKFLYRPLIERSDYVGGESRRLVDRLFGGRAAPLFAQLAESEALTDDDLVEIEALLREMRK